MTHNGHRAKNMNGEWPIPAGGWQPASIHQTNLADTTNVVAPEFFRTLA